MGFVDFLAILISAVLLTNTLTAPSANSESVYTAVIESFPPAVTMSVLSGYSDASAGISSGSVQGSVGQESPFLPSALITALAEESEQKRRIQRYRDVSIKIE